MALLLRFDDVWTVFQGVALAVPMDTGRMDALKCEQNNNMGKGGREMAQEKRPLVGGKYLEYMGRPLVRQDDTICYGDMTEKCILILEIFSREESTGLPKTVLIQVVDSQDPNKIIKQGQKDGLYNAFSIGLIWLERALQVE